MSEFVLTKQQYSLLTANIAVANIANIYTTNIVGFVGSQWSGTTPNPIYYAQQVGIGTASAPPASGPTLWINGNVYASNAIQTTNVVVSGNVNTSQFLIGGSVGTAGQVIQATGTGAGIQWATGGSGTVSSATSAQVAVYSGSTTVSGYSGLTFTSPSGPLTCAGDVIAYSDARIKTDLQIIDNPLDKLSRINGYTFIRTDSNDAKRHAGVIAQEVREVLPEVVYEEDDRLAVAYGNMIPLLIEAIKELKKEVEMLSKKI